MTDACLLVKELSGALEKDEFVAAAQIKNVFNIPESPQGYDG